MPVPKRRHSKGRVRRKRNQKMKQAIVAAIVCVHCKALKLPHRACTECGKNK